MLEGLRLACRRVQGIAGLALAIALALGTANAQKGAISFVQVNSATPIKQSSVTVSYTAAQTAGDLNVVVVGWNDSTAKISSIADSAGNTYAVAVGPTVQSGTATQAIYYAKSIVAAAANSNSVTVTFSAAANYPDLRIAEYSGLNPSNPLDVAVAAQGSSTSSSSGSVTTTNANDLLVGANLVQTGTKAAGTGYTSRVITNPDGDIFEDRVVTTTGSYSATASISPSGKWIMQMVAFRAAGTGAGTSPSITNVSPSSGPVGTSVTITGTNFGPSQGTSTVTFNGTIATPTNWSATSIAVPVPSGATTGNVVVTVSGVASNGANFTVTATSPSITSLNPNSGPIGTSVTIAGTNFGTTQGSSTIAFNGAVAMPTSWSATGIVVPVPTSATTGNVVVTVGGVASNGIGFTVAAAGAADITSISPGSGMPGTLVTLTGTNFGSTQGTSTVTFNGTVATPTNWSGTSIVAPVPSGATTGNVVVTVSGLASNGVSFMVDAPAAISFVQVSSAVPATPQTSVSATYTKEQTAGDLNVIAIGWSNSTATISSIVDSAGNTYAIAIGPTVQSGTATQTIYYAKNIVAAAANTNKVTVTFSTAANYPDLRIAEYAGLDPSNPLDVAVAATGSSTSSSSGSVTTTNANDLLVGANLVQTGTTAAGTGYTSRVITSFDGDILEDQIVAATGSYSATAPVSPSGKWIMQLVAFRAAGGGAGLSPNITSVSPSSGPVGTSVTITGTNFRTTQGSSTIAFNGAVAMPTNWSATGIVVPVPNGATTGNVVVTVGGQTSNGVSFTVTATSPSITSLNPNSGPIGTSVTIAGTNFGTTQGSSMIAFNGAVAMPTSWSATGIVVPVPTSATTGNVVVTVGGVASNGIGFTVAAAGAADITSISPGSGMPGTLVTLTGTNFGSTQGTSTVTFNGTVATPTNWSGTSIVAPVPSGATTGNVVVTVSGLASNGVSFMVDAPAAISFVQVSSAVPATPQTSVSATYTKEQTAGDLNVIAIGWSNSTATISSIVDSAGNTYAIAIGPTVQSGTATQTIYYAKNIVAAAANTNKVTVTFSTAANYPDLRIAEYAGLDPSNPLDVAVAATGSSTSSSSGSVTTTNANDLLVGANLVQTGTTAAGTGYTSRVITSFDGDILEDQIVAATGSYSATAPVSPSGKWIMQLVAFRAAGGGAGLSPNITSVSPSSGPVGTSVTITGTNFRTTQGSSTIAFNGAVAMPTNWSATGIVVPVPNGATTGNVVVTVGGQTSNGVSFTVTATSPSITSLNPNSGPIGTSVTIAGTNFGTTQGSSMIAFNGAVAMPTSWSATGIVVPVPTSATTGNVVVTVGGVASNGIGFTVAAAGAADITSISPGSGMPGTLVTLTGTNFGSTQGTSTVTFNGTVATPTNWSGTSIVAPVPSGATTGNVVVTVGLLPSNSVNFVVIALPLKSSANQRYLIDQNNVPFLMVGDSPQPIIALLGTADMATYMADRQLRGFNTIYVDVLVDTYTSGNADGTNFEGVPPFASGSSPADYDLSTPNPAYFSSLDTLVSMAASYGLVVMLDPIETGGWLPTLENNGATKAFNYGAYLGARYANSPNVIWQSGNDFQDWDYNSTDDNLVYQVMAGIASAAPNQLQTIELNYQTSYSNKDQATLGSTLTLDGAYTYYETYDVALQAYNSSPTLPTFLTEANYEFDNDTGHLPGPAGTFVLREQEYWAMTSGAYGQLYGNHYVWQFLPGWQNYLDSPGTLELAYWNQLFNSIPWWNLVPDQNNQIVTAGYGTYNGNNADLPLADYATTSWVPDGSLAVVYDVAGNSLTVNLAKFNQPVTAAWYDPSNGTFAVIPGSPFPNSGSHVFTPLGSNQDSERDWVLVLEVNPALP